MKKICYLLAFAMTLLVLLPVSSAFAATVGQQLTSPEEGWKRYDDKDPAIVYTGSWTDQTISGAYKGALKATTYNVPAAIGSFASFEFVGTKIRLIGEYWTTTSTSIDVYIDDEFVQNISQRNGSVQTRQILNYEAIDLPNGKHSVKIINRTQLYLVIDAIDIDESGYLINPNIGISTNLTASGGNANVQLNWSVVSDATSYNIKRSATQNGPYTTIASNIESVNFIDTSVTNGNTYYYIVTAVNSNGEGGSSNEASATPKVGVTIPAAPLNLAASGGDTKVTLTWDAVVGATGYKVKRSTTPGGPYTTITSNVYGASFVDTSVVNGTTYYYIVTAINSAGESGNSNEASATPTAPTAPNTGRALLVIQLTNGVEKEFDLSMTEVNAFISWYEGKAAGTGTASFGIDKHDNNKGPFKSRKDYVIFDKIVSYEVNVYTPSVQ
ncbi:hypothetical protein EYB31_16180 [Paenibacillus thalictri]|uniref:Fibronectin type-III domain-containing protein n=1 Tax=Paenibacillus thalictri TaxID=2527873 RepID=A0A4Q9DQ00_9BACL|nr:hypothetical protein EYB31_16180 [Paenibacillus thalictri]